MTMKLDVIEQAKSQQEPIPGVESKGSKVKAPGLPFDNVFDQLDQPGDLNVAANEKQMDLFPADQKPINKKALKIKAVPGSKALPTISKQQLEKRGIDAQEVILKTAEEFKQDALDRDEAIAREIKEILGVKDGQIEEQEEKGNQQQIPIPDLPLKPVTQRKPSADSAFVREAPSSRQEPALADEAAQPQKSTMSKGVKTELPRIPNPVQVHARLDNAEAAAAKPLVKPDLDKLSPAPQRQADPISIEPGETTRTRSPGPEAQLAEPARKKQSDPGQTVKPEVQAQKSRPDTVARQATEIPERDPRIKQVRQDVGRPTPLSNRSEAAMKPTENPPSVAQGTSEAGEPKESGRIDHGKRNLQTLERTATRPQENPKVGEATQSRSPVTREQDRAIARTVIWGPKDHEAEERPAVARGSRQESVSPETQKNLPLEELKKPETTIKATAADTQALEKPKTRIKSRKAVNPPKAVSTATEAQKQADQVAKPVEVSTEVESLRSELRDRIRQNLPGDDVTSGNRDIPRADSEEKADPLRPLAGMTSSTEKSTTAAQLQRGLNLKSQLPLVSRVSEVIADRILNTSESRTRFLVDGGRLGQVEIQFQQEENKNQVTIYVETEHSRQDLQRITPQIQENLAQRGINLQELEVEVRDFSLSKNGQEDEKSSGSDEHDQANEQIAADEEDESTTARDYGYNTMEIMA